jgi:crotonobetainyl-CoA:carnitine CoA-transferase CaiB-like acyl-CoA transferase
MAERIQRGSLDGLSVLDLSTIYAGPFTAALLGDFGAEVIKIEHPRGDPLRTHGPQKDGHGLWWKQLSRNKSCATLNLSTSAGQELLLKLVEETDIVIENFRPGVLERWGLGYDRLSAENHRLILLRTTGFGQAGPYAARPGFGTLAESMSGFATMTGLADGPPTLPPFGLADGIAGIAGAFAVMAAVHARDALDGYGQVIDLAIIEPILMVLGAQATAYDALGTIPRRHGNRSTNNAPRNLYKTRDGRWVAVSTSANRIASRLMQLVGHPEVVAEPWFGNPTERASRADLLDDMVGGWIAERDHDVVIKAFEAAGAAVAPVYDISEIVDDPQYRALETFIRLADDDLGSVLMQNVIARMSATPGEVRWAGRRLGQDNEAVYGRLGYSVEEIEGLRQEGVL